MEELWAELTRLRELVEARPRLHRKDVSRLLGISERQLSRRMHRRDFPKPVRDAGRPKWSAGQFAGLGLA